MFGGGSFGGAGGYGGGGGYGGFGGSTAGMPPSGGYGGAAGELMAGAHLPVAGDTMASTLGGYGAGMGQASQGLSGFMNAGNAQGEQPGAPAQQRAQTLTPVTIRMLNDAIKQQKSNGGQMAGLDAMYVVNGRELGMVTLVACVESIQQLQTFKAYTLSDGTGRLLVQCFGDCDAAGAQEIQPGEHVRIFGHLRGWQGQEGVNAHQIARVESANEISYHSIEVAHVHLSLTGKLVKPAAPAPIAPTAPQASMAAFPGMSADGGMAGRAPSAAVPGGGTYPQTGMAQAPGGQAAAPAFAGAPAFSGGGATAPSYGAYGGAGGGMATGAPPGQSPYGGGGPAGGAPPGQGQSPYGGMGMAPGGVGMGASGPAQSSPYGGAPAPGGGAPGAANPYGGSSSPYGGGALFGNPGGAGGAPPAAPGSGLWG
uniref:OB domain-containing protein n=1 Tax=Alexandrium monilatum TaxID=311494 RepID=A0A7S4SI25_9DINO|mmetsp:Transcript_37791/g.112800  ORF Transcript_37791/g.112800 Transcript_37791/m.112800 type:complete len:425 (-) Transcript_37791:202-1476(-)